MHDLDLQIQLLLEPDERDHDLGPDLDAFLLDLRGGLEDGARLHRRDFGIADAEAAATEAQHRIELVQLLDALMNRAAGTPIFLASSSCCSLVCGRNSWSGGSRKRIVAG